MKTVKVKYLKMHPKDAYFVGDIAEISGDKAADRLKTGHIMLLPEDEEDEEENSLPDDFPARDILFEAGFKTVDQVKEAGGSLTDIKGVGKGTLKHIEGWFEENEKPK